MSKVKLKTVLALTQNGKENFKRFIGDYTKFFSKDQSQFSGRKNTYSPRADTIDEPSKRQYVKVVTTVDEKLSYFQDSMAPYFSQVMDQEATNASGITKAELIVEGKSWGEFTSSELLRLKGFVENGDFKTMLSNIPVRSDSEVWKKSEQEEYKSRSVFEKEEIKSISKSLRKEAYILKDPNITEANAARYTPVQSTLDTVIELGDITTQEFTGAWSHFQRATALRKMEILRSAVVEALAKANDVDIIESKLSGDMFFDYLFKN